MLLTQRVAGPIVLPMALVEELTEEQKAKIPEYLEMGLKIGRSTERVDHERAKAAIIALFTAMKYPEPTVYFTDGIRSGVQKAAELEHGPNPSKAQKSEILGQSAYGGSDAYWVVQSLFLVKEIGLDQGDTPPVDILMEVIRTCGWWWPLGDKVVIADRPHTLKLDDEGRMHCEDGPACAFVDGTKAYFWHGTPIEAEWVEDKDNVDPSLAITHENAESRRALAEILGWHAVLEQLDTKVIDEDADPVVGTLLDAEIPDEGRQRFLRVLCPKTDRIFALRIPPPEDREHPEIDTALKAQAWIQGVGVDIISKIKVRA